MTEYIANNIGDIRRRTRYIGIEIPLNSTPKVTILEQDAVKLPQGERVIEDLKGLNFTISDFNEEFPLRNPETDELLGSNGNVAQAFALIYSWVRAKQVERDSQE
jgi:hypothetical protein